MKKLALALVASSFVAGAATAEINTGFYVGLGAGMGNFTADTHTPGVSSIDLGRNRPTASIYTGYGVVNGCTYLGFELGYTFTGGKASTSNALNGSRLAFERRNIINSAFLIGQKFSPSTMGYLRLGMNSAQYKASATAAGSTAAHTKRKISFAPGLGMETAVTRNVRLRLEYTYDLGNNFKGRSVLGTTTTKIRSQGVTLGVAYKF